MKMALTKRMVVWVPMLAAAMMFCGCATIYENTHAYLGSPALAPINGSGPMYGFMPRNPKGPKDPLLGEVILSIDGNPPPRKNRRQIKEGSGE